MLALIARLGVVAVIGGLLLTACSTDPPPEVPVLLVNPIYPEDVYDVAQPKVDDLNLCDRYSTDEAAALLGTPVRTAPGLRSCSYAGLDGDGSGLTLRIANSPRSLDETSYVTLSYGRRDTVGGNSAWILDFGPGKGCSVEAALSAGRSGRTLSVDGGDTLTCAQVLTAVRIIFDRVPDDPTTEPRTIPELDRQRAVIPADPPVRGLFPSNLPPHWITTSLDDPRYRHDTDATPAW